MWRYAVGAAATILLVAAGWLWTRAPARQASLLPIANAAAPAAQDDGAGVEAPTATALTREQKRFNRYDKDRNGAITREEYLASRRKAFAKLDANHDGTLQFDEWAAKTEAKFATADADRNGAMSAAEFATTAVKRKPSRTKPCLPGDRPPPNDEEAG